MSTVSTLRPFRAFPSEALYGNVRVPGDKSMSHRALLLSALAIGESRIEGLLEGEDVLCTAAALRACGVPAERQSDGSWQVLGRGVGGLKEPSEILDLGNSGTSARLLMGVLAGQPIRAFMTGDASLNRRPMRRVSEPLSRMGVTLALRGDRFLPLLLEGPERLLPITYEMPVASAQVKSAVLLAGLAAPGSSGVIETQATRDHSERMLRYLGATVTDEAAEGGGREIRVVGERELKAKDLTVMADPSSAAFPVAAAALLPGSELQLPAIGINPLRTGLYGCLAEMGAEIAFANPREQSGEPVADLTVKGGRLKGIEVLAERAPSMIDEYPILAVAAACAEGRSVMRGLGELRVKESDRLTAVAEGLAANGVTVAIEGDDLIVEGCGGRVPGGGLVATHRDHRIAMSFLVLGLAAEQAVTVDDVTFVDTSFPGFAALVTGLGAKIEAAS
ncbi:MAG: 3-phosphoshikimate 1-carboxyvinyltransferase [Rhodospirillales bacterium]|nr:3-phosphoshikimate 1-carboxyvinyltransferase [Rhodospirillales bacterium]